MSRAIIVIEAGAVAAMSAGGMAAALFCLLSGSPLIVLLSPLIVVVGTAYALPHVALLGLPIYLLLSRLWRVDWWNATVLGALIGGVPTTLLLFGGMSEPAAEGELAAGAAIFGFCAACGTAAGYAFWHRLARSELWKQT
ncbi:hypothetical protein [Sphingomonas sp. G-3-2-10]|uniref:hypothetical protein n=1 Tax=Sphingomonas sp. G-3-2-10 TaxID=2728838 RepID=UPI00146C47BA|nr:hypothetical protein [Sphingomonas sp. G-3-2-10]NML05923.1 hypothetical protein [Sphingomonas sp. G-3-2-10]